MQRIKKIDLSLLIHRHWLDGEAGQSEEGEHYGGSVSNDVEATIRWNIARVVKQVRLLEVRGELPDQVVCPETGQVAEDW